MSQTPESHIIEYSIILSHLVFISRMRFLKFDMVSANMAIEGIAGESLSTHSIIKSMSQLHNLEDSVIYLL